MTLQLKLVRMNLALVCIPVCIRMACVFTIDYVMVLNSYQKCCEYLLATRQSLSDKIVQACFRNVWRTLVSHYTPVSNGDGTIQFFV